MKLHRILFLLGLSACVLATAAIVPIVGYRFKGNAIRTNTSEMPVLTEPVVATNADTVSGKPAILYIPSLNMTLEVTEGMYNRGTGEWTLSPDKVHFAELSVRPNNETGNTLIYGHYRPEVFARLHHITPGAEAVVRSDNGYQFIYIFKNSQITNPADASIFAYRGLPKLTLQTCTGAWMQNRQLFSFDFVRYEKS